MATKPYRIDLHDVIGMWGMTTSDFRRHLRQAGDADLELHIDSPGGSVSDGFAIVNMLKGYTGRKVAVIDGFCASAATLISCACDEVLIHAQAAMMIHDPSAGAYGTADDLDIVSDLLRKLSDMGRDLYQKRTGADEATVRGWMSTDTWFSPTEALTAKLVDRIVEMPAKFPSEKAAQQSVERVALLLAQQQNVPAHVVALMQARIAVSIPQPTVSAQSTTGVLKMKSSPNTIGLRVALAGLIQFAAACVASDVPEEQEAGKALIALKLDAHLSALGEVKAPELQELMQVHAKAVEMVGSEDGVLGGLEAIKRNTSAGGSAAASERAAKVETLLQQCVQERKLHPQDVATYRQAYASDPNKKLADLEQFRRLAVPFADLATQEEQGRAADRGADEEPGEEFLAAVNANKVQGKHLKGVK